MATTTLKIKRSLLEIAPVTLQEGELGFSYASNILYIGGPGGATVLPISGAGGGVSSVNGQTGDVVLNYTSVGAAPTVHSHTSSQITDFAPAVQALLPTSLVNSVNGQTGIVTLTYTDVGAAPTIHDHTASQITDFTAAVEALIPPPPVVSVNGQTGTVVLTYTDVGAAPTVHTHTASQITDFDAAVDALVPVKSVNGETGAVVLNYVDVGAAPTIHTHTASQITDFEPEVNALIDTATAALKFTDLSDAPASYVGQAGRGIVVNGTEDGLTFAAEIDGGTY